MKYHSYSEHCLYRYLEAFEHVPLETNSPASFAIISIIEIRVLSCDQARPQQ
jgi:hypothetical protein